MQSSARSHLVSETKNTIEDLYDFSHKTPTQIKARVAYLLENDRFTCHPSKLDVSKLRSSPMRRSKAYPNRNVVGAFQHSRYQNSCFISGTGARECGGGPIKHFLIVLTTS